MESLFCEDCGRVVLNFPLRCSYCCPTREEIQKALRERKKRIKKDQILAAIDAYRQKYGMSPSERNANGGKHE